MKKILIVFITFLCILIFPSGCFKNSETKENKNQDIEAAKDISSHEINEAANGNFLDLSQDEIEIYNHFKEKYDDEVLRGSSPITLMKLYFYAENMKDFETQYELYIDDPNSVLWSKEEFIKVANVEKKDEDISSDSILSYFENAQDPNVSYTTGAACVEINEEEGIGFSLKMNKDGIWKVSYLPLQ